MCLIRFCRIQYMFESCGEKKFHAHWFQHGSQILLQETAHPQGLFLIDECDDLPLSCIYQKCNLRTLGRDEEEPPTECAADDNNFFTRYSCDESKCSYVSTIVHCVYSFLWDPDNSEFIDLSESHYEATIRHCKSWRPCFSCGRKIIKREHAQWKLEPDGGVSRLGVTYHQYDFVYLRPSRQRRDYPQVSASPPRVTLQANIRCARCRK